MLCCVLLLVQQSHSDIRRLRQLEKVEMSRPVYFSPAVSAGLQTLQQVDIHIHQAAPLPGSNPPQPLQNSSHVLWAVDSTRITGWDVYKEIF